MIRKFRPVCFSVLFFLFCGMIHTGCRTITIDSAQAGFSPGTVVFSFDDGPNDHEDTTLRLLEVLEKYHIRGCFFLLGINAEHNPDLVRRIAAGGHRIFNHGYEDKWAVFLNDKTFISNLSGGERAIGAALEGGELPLRVYRPHGGFYKNKQRRLWEEEGYRAGFCTIRIYDAVLTSGDRDKAAARIIEEIEKQGGGIILLHDTRGGYADREKQLARKPQGPFNRSWIPAVVEELILMLQEKGFRMSGFDPAEIPGVMTPP